jgi:FAD:protein FMN transferase
MVCTWSRDRQFLAIAPPQATMHATVVTMKTMTAGEAILLLIAALVLYLNAAARDDHTSKTSITHQTINGDAFGSSWQVTAATATLAQLRPSLQASIDLVNQTLSSWNPQSDVTRVNMAAVDAWTNVDAHSVLWLRTAQQVHRDTGGAFDVTIGPLLDVWGFSAKTKGRITTMPSANDIARARAQLGSDTIVLSASAVQRTSDVHVDATSIGDGAAAGAMAKVLMDAGVNDFLVDVAGEVVAHGSGPRGPWRVGINRPSTSALPSEVVAVVSLDATREVQALSTSGTYRETFLVDNVEANHIIDPRSGRPASGPLVSCTIIGRDIVVADAWSTACLVLGEQETRRRIGAFRLSAVFVLHDASGFEVRATAGATITLPDDQ